MRRLCTFVSNHATFATARRFKSPQLFLFPWVLFWETFWGRWMFDSKPLGQNRVTLTRLFSTGFLQAASGTDTHLAKFSPNDQKTCFQANFTHNTAGVC